MNKKHLIHSILLLIIIAFAFYWFEFRPQKIRKACTKETINVYVEVSDKSSNSDNIYEAAELYYKICIRAKGLKE